MTGRRIAFWGAVAGVSILANFALEVAADRTRSQGLARLASYTHKGKG